MKKRKKILLKVLELEKIEEKALLEQMKLNNNCNNIRILNKRNLI